MLRETDPPDAPLPSPGVAEGIGIATRDERQLEIRDELSATRNATWSRFAIASTVTVFAPGQFLWESFFYWTERWPDLGPAVFIVLIACAVGAWWHRALIVLRRRALRAELTSLDES